MEGLPNFSLFFNLKRLGKTRFFRPDAMAQALVKYSALVNGFDSLNITKLDVLTGLKQIRVAIAYRLRELFEGRWRFLKVWHRYVVDSSAAGNVFVWAGGWGWNVNTVANCGMGALTRWCARKKTLNGNEWDAILTPVFWWNLHHPGASSCLLLIGKLPMVLNIFIPYALAKW